MKKLNNILLIDDNDDDNFFHTMVIKKADAADQVDVMTSGERALEYLQKISQDERMPDLIFLDIKMPGLNGFEFLEEARKSQLIRPGMPVVIIMLTSSLNPYDQQLADTEFADMISMFHNKPLTAAMLAGIIERFFPENTSPHDTE